MATEYGRTGIVENLPSLAGHQLESAGDSEGLVNLAIGQTPSNLIRQVEWSWLNSDSPAVDMAFINPTLADWTLGQFRRGVDEVI
jgi:hypothetical protein